MNLARYERNQWFERVMALKAQHDPNRVVTADEWSPDTSAIDGPMWADNRAAMAATEDWWADIARLREKFPHE